MSISKDVSTYWHKDESDVKKAKSPVKQNMDLECITDQ